MFSHLSENRFPKGVTKSVVGPGSYDVRSSLDERAALIREGGDRFEDSICCNSECSFAVFVDEVDGPRTPRTHADPRTPRGSRQVPFGRSTKENIVASLSARGKIFGDEAKDRSIAELQQRVEELESEGVNLSSKVSEFEAEREECERKLEELAAPGEKIAGLMEQLNDVTAEKERLQRSLVAVASQSKEPQAITSLVAELVAQELSDPRRVLSLQRTAWEREANELRQQTERLERKVEQREQEQRKGDEDTLARADAAEASAVAAAELAELRQEEVTRLTAALQAAHQLNADLQREKQEAVVASEAQRAEVETAKLEERRLRQVAAEAQDSMERSMEREAKLAGHANHKQKIRITLDLKKENCTLRGEVQRLQQQLNRKGLRQVQQRQPLASARSSVCSQVTPRVSPRVSSSSTTGLFAGDEVW